MPGLFEKFVFELEASSYIKMDLTLAKQLISLQKMLSILIFGSPVYTTLILAIIIEMGDDLGCNNVQKHADSPAEVPT